jgi:hypothetical protein
LSGRKLLPLPKRIFFVLTPLRQMMARSSTRSMLRGVAHLRFKFTLTMAAFDLIRLGVGMTTRLAALQRI